MEYTGQAEEARARNIWLQLSNKQSGDMDWDTLAKIVDETNQAQCLVAVEQKQM